MTAISVRFSRLAVYRKISAGRLYLPHWRVPMLGHGSANCEPARRFLQSNVSILFLPIHLRSPCLCIVLFSELKVEAGGRECRRKDLAWVNLQMEEFQYQVIRVLSLGQDRQSVESRAFFWCCGLRAFNTEFLTFSWTLGVQSCTWWFSSCVKTAYTCSLHTASSGAQVYNLSSW